VKTECAFTVFGRKVILFFLYYIGKSYLFNYVFKEKRFFVDYRQGEGGARACMLGGLLLLYKHRASHIQALRFL
jgi:hypothetical protein